MIQEESRVQIPSGPPLSTTTVLHFGRLKGLSLDIIFILCEEDQPLRTVDIANALGKSRKITYKALRRMAHKGLVSYVEGLWLALGSAVKVYKLLKRPHKDTTKTPSRHHQDTTFKTNVIKSSQKSLSKPIQIKIDLWLSQYQPTEAEEVVVNTLVDHYNRTGQPGILLQDPYDYYEHGIHLSPEDFNKARISLQNEGIITWGRYKDKAAWKIALKKDFIMRLNEVKR